MDETQPLLPRPEDVSSDISNLSEAIRKDIVDFDADDETNPVNWSPAYKWTSVALLAFMAFTVSVFSLNPTLPPH